MIKENVFYLSAHLRYWDVILITIGISGLALALALICGCIFGSRKVSENFFNFDYNEYKN